MYHLAGGVRSFITLAVSNFHLPALYGDISVDVTAVNI